MFLSHVCSIRDASALDASARVRSHARKLNEKPRLLRSFTRADFVFSPKTTEFCSEKRQFDLRFNTPSLKPEARLSASSRIESKQWGPDLARPFGKMT